MIISVNTEPNRQEFDNLLNAAVEELNLQAKQTPEMISRLVGRQLEPHIKDVLTKLAVGTPFDNTIELIGGQKFPDIIAKKYYGIEVKTTTQNHWKTTGNSVFEGTRIEDVERIYMLFAKLANPIEFRCRPYEECLSEIVVTHSPRYQIDMNLEKGETIFDKINIPYDVLRKQENPIKPIIEYYKKQLKPGDDLWWIDQENSRASNIVLRTWNNLSMAEKQEIKNKSMVYFPELFSNRNDKFSRFSIWLVTQAGIVCPNVRDLHTAGGKGSFGSNQNVPRIFLNLFENIYSIRGILDDSSVFELSNYWGIDTNVKTKISDWINLVSDNSKSILNANHLNIKNIINKLISN